MNDEQDEVVVAVGVIQLILDLLKQSCNNPGTNDFHIPSQSMMSRRYMETIVATQSLNKVGSLKLCRNSEISELSLKLSNVAASSVS